MAKINKFNDYKFPAISVIIPTYNVEKYIVQCLNSLLNQTFQDFEVIVIDDCSKDNSVKEIENMAAKFKGRLQLIKRTKNAGGAAIPRNTGINLSHGKYLFFLDGDDIILSNAFEVLYNAAKQTKADVVHVEKNLLPISNDDTINSQTKFRLDTHQSPPFVDKITLETEDIGNRVERFCQKKFFWWACSKLFRRDFLIENDIKFVQMQTTEDMLFSFACVCCAKNYVRIPNAIYIYRQNPNSAVHGNRKMEKAILDYLVTVNRGTNELHKFMNKVDFFNIHPEYKYVVTNFFIQTQIGWQFGVYAKNPTYILDLILHNSFKAELENSDLLIVQLFGVANFYYSQIQKLQKQLQSSQYPPPMN